VGRHEGEIKQVGQANSRPHHLRPPSATIGHHQPPQATGRQPPSATTISRHHQPPPSATTTIRHHGSPQSSSSTAQEIPRSKASRVQRPGGACIGKVVPPGNLVTATQQHHHYHHQCRCHTATPSSSVSLPHGNPISIISVTATQQHHHHQCHCHTATTSPSSVSLRHSTTTVIIISSVTATQQHHHT
jgi:hypothetical protein